MRMLVGAAHVGYFAMGVVGLFALIEGLDHWFGLGGFLSFILALFVTWIPLVGQIAATVGAAEVWGWDLWVALLFFFWPMVLWIGAAAIGWVVER